MRKIISIFLLVLMAPLVGCGEQFDVKYLVCDIDAKNCITVAKFKELDSCERVKFRHEAYCDQVSVPGKMVCDIQRKSSISTSFCTK